VLTTFFLSLIFWHTMAWGHS